MELSSEEKALVEEFRRQRIQTEAERAHAAAAREQPFNLEDIRPGMSAEDLGRARQSILEALRKEGYC